MEYKPVSLLKPAVAREVLVSVIDEFIQIFECLLHAGNACDAECQFLLLT